MHLQSSPTYTTTPKRGELNQIKSMGSKTSSSRAKPFIFFLLFLSSYLFFIVLTFRPKPNLINTHGLQHQAKISNGINLIAKEFKGKNVKVGLVNIVGDRIEATYRLLGLSESKTETVKVRF